MTGCYTCSAFSFVACVCCRFWRIKDAYEFRLPLKIERALYSQLNYTITGWPKKVSQYQESLLNRINNRQLGYIFHQF